MKLHQADRREGFRDRANSETGVGRNWNTALRVRDPESLRVDDAAIRDNSCGYTRERPVVAGRDQEFIDSFLRSASQRF